MPTYVYKFIDTGETIEVHQAFTDDALTVAVHPTTGATMEVKKVFLPVGVTFRGGGFYKTDSRGPGAKSKSTNSDSSSDSSSDKSSGEKSSGEKSSGEKSSSAAATSDKSVSSTSTSTESSSSSTKTPAASTPAASSSSSD